MGNQAQARDEVPAPPSARPRLDDPLDTLPGIGPKRVRLLANLGLLSVRDMISRWAPPNENDTEKYVMAVAEQMGVRADQQLNLARDSARLGAMVRAIIQQENGRNIYDHELVNDGVAAALQK